MMKNYLLGFFLIYLTQNSVVGQQVSDLPPNSFPFNFKGTQLVTFDNRYEGVHGFPTFLEDFTPGRVFLKNEQHYNNILINYDVVNDDLIAKSEKMEGHFQVRKDLVERFTLITDQTEFSFEKKTLNGVPTFVLKLVEHETIFYCKISKFIKRAEMGGAYNVSDKKYDEFQTVNSYYFQDQESFLKEIPNSKKGVIKTFPKIANRLNNYFKQNKVDFNNYDSMIALFSFIAGVRD